MKMNTPEIQKIRSSWERIDVVTMNNFSMTTRDVKKYGDVFKVYDRHGEETQIIDWYHWYRDPISGKLAFKIKKNYWAKGRTMRIESKIDNVVSGTYKIVGKAQSNSYDCEDFVIVEYDKPDHSTPRKALNWLEKQLAELEAEDGITTEQLVKEMNVRGY